jgi:CelD/BcsL family acetyltransferase involved in cellulose biosynthesis
MMSSIVGTMSVMSTVTQKAIALKKNFEVDLFRTKTVRMTFDYYIFYEEEEMAIFMFTLNLG